VVEHELARVMILAIDHKLAVPLEPKLEVAFFDFERLHHDHLQTAGLRTAAPVQVCVGNFNPCASSCL
jgi:hypothetical protein